MHKLVVTGGRALCGEIPVGGAKNSALKLMVAALLTDEPLVLDNVPRLADVASMGGLLSGLGVRADFDSPVLYLHARRIASIRAPYDHVRKMRASFNVLGPLLAREGRAEVSLPGGCAIGARPVDLHLMALKALGARIELDGGYVRAEAPRGLTGADIVFPSVSVGATEHAMLAAVLAKGRTVLSNAACEPEITDLARCLEAMGAAITGAGQSTVTIEGVGRLRGCRYRVMPDRIETGAYAMAVGAAGGELTLTGTSTEILGAALPVMQKTGLVFRDGDRGMHVTRRPARPGVTDIVTRPFPGFPTDLQAPFMAMMAVADGVSVIRETVFENRFMHVPELCRMGADISVDGQVATVCGKRQLKAAPVMATDLRASVSLVIAALAARGQTVISRVYHLDRGFERLEEKLGRCGALVARIED